MEHALVDLWSCRTGGATVVYEAIHDTGEDAMAAHSEPVRLIGHWWWAKGQVGPFTFVTAHLAHHIHDEQ